MSTDLIRDYVYTLRFRRHEMAALRQAAQLERQQLSEFVRRVVLDAAQRRLRAAGSTGDADVRSLR